MFLKISRETLLRAVPKGANESILQDNKTIWVGKDLG